MRSRLEGEHSFPPAIPSSDNDDMSVTIEVQLPDDLIPLLEQRARGAGLDRQQYLRSIVSRDLTGPRRLDDILGAFRHQVSETGMSDAELFDLFDAARNDVETKADR